MPTTAMSARSRAGRVRRALPLLALAAVAACADGPSEPLPPSELDLLRAATLASDSLGVFAGGGMAPMHFGIVAPVPVAPLMPMGGAVTFMGSGCAYSPATGRTECGPSTFEGMTFRSTFAFFDREGRAQERFDPATTDRIEFTSQIAGTRTFPLRTPDGGQQGTVSLTVDRTAAQSTSGLLDPSGLRRMDGTAEGTESHVITTPRGTVRLAREFADTTANLVMPAFRPPSGPHVGPFVPPAPVSGRIVRVSRTVETPPTGAPRTTDLRVVTEFLPGGVARTTITVNGVTHVCTQDLTRYARPQCS